MSLTYRNKRQKKTKQTQKNRKHCNQFQIPIFAVKMSETDVKPESDGVAISAACVRITALAATKSNTGGLTNEDLNTELSDIPVATRLQAINKLLQSGTIELLQKGKSLIYRIKDAGKGSAPGNIDNEEKVIYQIIEEGGNKGIWIRDIRTKSNLIMTQLNKILKNLENKKLIKAVKSVNVSVLLLKPTLSLIPISLNRQARKRFICYTIWNPIGQSVVGLGTKIRTLKRSSLTS